MKTCRVFSHLSWLRGAPEIRLEGLDNLSPDTGPGPGPGLAQQLDQKKKKGLASKGQKKKPVLV